MFKIQTKIYIDKLLCNWLPIIGGYYLPRVLLCIQRIVQCILDLSHTIYL